MTTHLATGYARAGAVDDAAGDRAAGGEPARDPGGEGAVSKLDRGGAADTGMLGLVLVEARRETSLARERG